MKNIIHFSLMIVPLLILLACTNESQDAVVIGVEFEWQSVDFGSSENPKIRLTGVPEGSQRFFVGLVDLNVSTYDHGGGFADNDGSGIIARGAVNGNYNGPAPWLPGMVHDYEITVKAYDENGKVIGVGKNVKKFLFGPVE